MDAKFTYDDFLGAHTITLKRAAPEWCNSDCPTLTSVSDDPRLDNWRLNDGVVMEDLPEEMAVAFVKFFIASARAYYRKYEPYTGGNGFLSNFYRQNMQINQRKYPWLPQMLTEIHTEVRG